jgi:hypothetical protein
VTGPSFNLPSKLGRTPLFRRAFRAVAAAGLCGLLAQASVAQSPAGGGPPGMKPVDEGYADLTPFSLSFRVMQLDLRLPVGFEHVYELAPDQQPVTRAPWATGVGHRYARQSGALTIVFPQSLYVPTKKGNAAPVPADSRFVIGSIPTVAPKSSPRPAAYNAVMSSASTIADRRADRVSTLARSRPSHTPASQVVDSSDVSIAPPGVLTNENYRIRRVRALLDEAAGAVGAGPPDR